MSAAMPVVPAFLQLATVPGDEKEVGFAPDLDAGALRWHEFSSGGNSMHAPTLVIMAAGMGSRFGGLKQITPVDERGHIIMDLSLFDAWRAGFRDLVFIVKPATDSSTGRWCSTPQVGSLPSRPLP